MEALDFGQCTGGVLLRLARRAVQKSEPAVFALPRGGFVPHIVPRDRFYCEESWSEWQDLNLRPPRPERDGESPMAFRFG